MSQFGIQYRATVPPDARWSRVKILCKHHPDQVIAQWSTFDGQQVLVGLGDGAREEYFGYWSQDNVPGGPQGQLAKVLTPAVAAPWPGDTAHSRITLHCDRQSCSYRPQIREEKVKILDALVLALWADGGAVLEIWGLDSMLRAARK